MPYGNIVFGGVTLDVRQITKSKVAGTIKQIQGGDMSEQVVPGRAKEFRITIEGDLQGSTKDADRTSLENLDNANPHEYSDGLITIKAIIPNGGLEFRDDGGKEATVVEYTMELFEFLQ